MSFGLDISGLGFFPTSKVWDLQRAYKWSLLMPSNFSGVIGYLVSQYCQDITFGDYSISELSILKSGAFQRFYAGLQTIDSVTLIFLVPSDNSLRDYFYGWYEKMIDKKGYYYPKLNYKRDIYLMFYDQMEVQSVRFLMRGCFPKTHLVEHPSYTEEGVLTAQITLSIDKLEPTGGYQSVARSALAKVFGI